MAKPKPLPPPVTIATFLQSPSPKGVFNEFFNWFVYFYLFYLIKKFPLKLPL